MRTILLTMALLLVIATGADAADRFGRSNYGGGFYVSRSGREIYQPQTNTMWRGSRVNGGTYYQSGPITQYGAPGINYQYNNNGSIDLYGSGLIQPARGVRPPGW